MYASFSSTAYTPPVTFIAGEFPRVDEKVVVLAGRTLLAGSVLGRITASGKCVLSTAAATDGSQTPYAILAEDVTAPAGADAEAVAYLTGQFRAAALTFGAGHTAAALRAALRDLSIFI